MARTGFERSVSAAAAVRAGKGTASAFRGRAGRDGFVGWKVMADSGVTRGGGRGVGGQEDRRDGGGGTLAAGKGAAVHAGLL